jgi:hypothetical protein
MILRHLTLAHAQLAASLLLARPAPAWARRVSRWTACPASAAARRSSSAHRARPAVAQGRTETGLNPSSFSQSLSLADEHYRVLTDEPGMGDYAGRIEAILGKNFCAQ